MATLPVYEKDPQDILDYGFNWQGGDPGPWLSTGETVTVSTWTVSPAGLTIGNGSNGAPAPLITGGTATTVWVLGGTLGVIYVLVNHITTSQSRQVDRSLEIKVRSL